MDYKDEMKKDIVSIVDIISIIDLILKALMTYDSLSLGEKELFKIALIELKNDNLEEL